MTLSLSENWFDHPAWARLLDNPRLHGSAFLLHVSAVSWLVRHRQMNVPATVWRRLPGWTKASDKVLEEIGLVSYRDGTAVAVMYAGVHREELESDADESAPLPDDESTARRERARRAGLASAAKRRRVQQDVQRVVQQDVQQDVELEFNKTFNGRSTGSSTGSSTSRSTDSSPSYSPPPSPFAPSPLSPPHPPSPRTPESPTLPPTSSPSSSRAHETGLNSSSTQNQLQTERNHPVPDAKPHANSLGANPVRASNELGSSSELASNESRTDANRAPSQLETPFTNARRRAEELEDLTAFVSKTYGELFTKRRAELGSPIDLWMGHSAHHQAFLEIATQAYATKSPREAVVKVVGGYLSDRDAWLVEHDYPPKALVKAFNKYLNPPKKAPRVLGPAPLPAPGSYVPGDHTEAVRARFGPKAKTPVVVSPDMSAEEAVAALVRVIG